MLSNLFENPAETIFFVVALIIAITIHEFAHAWTADYLGDPTPGKQGRLSLNPLKHLDPAGTLFLLIAGFGWGKPVITDPSYYKKPKTDYAITSLAGPFSNLMLAILFSLPATIATILGHDIQTIAFFRFTEIVYSANFLLFIFNLIPIYPLDGSKLVMAFIHNRNTLYRYINVGPKILFFLLIINIWIPIISWFFIITSVILNLIIRGIPVSLFT